MNSLLPQTGLLMMFSYALLNLYNVMLLRISLPFVSLLPFIAAAFYLFYRLYLLSRDKRGLSQNEVMCLILILLSGTALLLQFLNLQDLADEDGRFALQKMRTEWRVSMMYILAGGGVALFSLEDSPKLAIIVLVATALAFLNGLNDQLMVDYKGVKDTGVVDDISHLSLERSIVFLLVLAYALSSKTKWLVALVGLFLLFSMGGRTSLAVFAICIVVMNVSRKHLINLVYLAIIGLIIFFSLRYVVENQIIDTEDNRVMKMLFIGGVEEDSSYLARKEIFAAHVKYLGEQFLYGDSTLIVKEFGKTNAYIHNLLSAWQFYGFFVFAWIVLILIVSLRRMIILKIRNPEPKIIFGSFFLLYVVISATIAKSAAWDLLWFIIGFWTLLLTQKTQKRKGRRRRRVRN